MKVQDVQSECRDYEEKPELGSTHGRDFDVGTDGCHVVHVEEGGVGVDVQK